jgi:hypothetical protein
MDTHMWNSVRDESCEGSERKEDRRCPTSAHSI